MPTPSPNRNPVVLSTKLDGTGSTMSASRKPITASVIQATEVLDCSVAWTSSFMRPSSSRRHQDESEQQQHEHTPAHPRRSYRPLGAARRPPNGEVSGSGLPRAAHSFTNSLKPPQNMRLASNGGFFGVHHLLEPRVLHDLGITLSRCWRDLKTIHENTTTSPFFSFTERGNDVHLPFFTSSATFS